MTESSREVPYNEANIVSKAQEDEKLTSKGVTRRNFLVGLAGIAASIEAESKPKEASLKGSPESLRKQNKDNLPPIKDDVDLERLIKNGELQPLQEMKGMVIDPDLKEKYRYARPWVIVYLRNLANRFNQKFNASFQLNSATRTIERQLELRKEGNKNTASIVGPKRSPHLSGEAVDIAKIGLTKEQKDWLRTHLKANEYVEIIEATEEHRQQVFHFTVFKPKVVTMKRAVKSAGKP